MDGIAFFIWLMSSRICSGLQTSETKGSYTIYLQQVQGKVIITEFLCSGTLVSEKTAVTSSNCLTNLEVESARELQVSAGTFSIEDKKSYKRKAKRIYTHEMLALIVMWRRLPVILKSIGFLPVYPIEEKMTGCEIITMNVSLKRMEFHKCDWPDCKTIPDIPNAFCIQSDPKLTSKITDIGTSLICNESFVSIWTGLNSSISDDQMVFHDIYETYMELTNEDRKYLWISRGVQNKLNWFRILFFCSFRNLRPYF